MATAGMNGNNEAKIGNSRQTGISYFDANNRPIKISNLQNKISLFIYRDANLGSSVNLNFNLINTSNKSDPSLYTANQMLTYSFQLTGANNSIQIQVKPDNPRLNIGYLMFLKFGSAPVYNASLKSFDFAKLSCPTGKLTASIQLDLNRTDGLDLFLSRHGYRWR